MIKIPSFFREFFGEKQRGVELVATLAFALIATTFIFLVYHESIVRLLRLEFFIFIALTLDITGGVIANLTFGTDQFYAKNRKARLIFIAVHIQPFIYFLITQQPLWIGSALWIYTMVCAIALEMGKNHPSHKVWGGVCLFVGIGLIFVFESALIPLISLVMIMYMFKVLFSFSLNHYHGGNYATSL